MPTTRIRVFRGGHRDIRVTLGNFLCTPICAHTVEVDSPVAESQSRESAETDSRLASSSQKWPCRVGALPTVPGAAAAATVSAFRFLDGPSVHRLWHAACFCIFVVSKFGWWKVLFGIALVLLPGSMLLLPVVLLIASRRRPQREPGEVSFEGSSSLPSQTDLSQLAAGDAPTVQLGNACG